MAVSTKSNGIGPDEYLELVQKFPLKPIRNGDQLREAHKIIDDMTKIPENKLTRDQEKRWAATCTAMARRIRLADSDRLWVAHAEEITRKLGELPGEEEEERDPNDPESTIPASRASTRVESTPAFKKLLPALVSQLT